MFETVDPYQKKTIYYNAVVGKLKNRQEQNVVLELSEKLNWPVFPDISSGLRLGNKHKNVIHYYDQIL